MQVIKLGGSAITDKSKYKSFKCSTVKRLANELARAKTPAIVVHGAGSFGHILADKHNLKSGFSNITQLRGFAEVHRDVRELNMLIINELFKAGVNAVSVPPGSFVKAEGGNILSIDTHRFEEYLALGLYPVTFGDLVLDSRQGFCVCSGDTIVLHVARSLQARRAIFVTDVDGIYGRKRGRSHLLSEIIHLDQIAKLKQADGGKCDVTGGIRSKAMAMLGLAEAGIESILINGNGRGRLLKALRGDAVKGTIARVNKML